MMTTNMELLPPHEQNLTAFQSNLTQNMDDLSPSGYAIVSVFLFLIMVFGITNNLLVIVVIGNTKKLRTPMNFILLNLSVSDFIISAFGTPMSFISALNRKWIFGDTLCQAYAFLMTLTGMTALGTLSAIAIERYIIISRSLHCQKLTNASAFLTIASIWIYSLSQSLPPLFGWNQYVVETPGIACSLNWEEPGSKHVSYIAYIFVFGYVLPLGIMSFCYISVVRIIKKSPKPAGRCSSTAKAEHKVTLMASAMIVCTVIAWTPYAVVSLMASMGYRHLLGPVAAVSPAVFAKTSVIYNPIVYFFFNTQIRDVIVSKFPGKRHRGPTSTEISMETKRGLTIINTVISSPKIGCSAENVTTKNL